MSRPLGPRPPTADNKGVGKETQRRGHQAADGLSVLSGEVDNSAGKGLWSPHSLLGEQPVSTFAGPQEAPGCQAGTGSANMGGAAGSHRLPEFLRTGFLVPHQVCVTRWTDASLSPPPAPEAHCRPCARGRRPLLSSESVAISLLSFNRTGLLPTHGPKVFSVLGLKMGSSFRLVLRLCSGGTPKWSSPGPCVSSAMQAGEKGSALSPQDLFLMCGWSYPNTTSVPCIHPREPSGLGMV